MTATDTLRSVIRDLEAKAREMELDKKIATFADQADHVLREAASRAGEYAAENRERVEATLEKAGAKVDEKTDGKYHRAFDTLKTGVLTGVDWVAEQRESRPAGSDAPTTDTTTDTAGPATAAGRGASTSGPPAAGEDVAGQGLVGEGTVDEDSQDDGITSEGAWSEATDTEPPTRTSEH